MCCTYPPLKVQIVCEPPGNHQVFHINLMFFYLCTTHVFKIKTIALIKWSKTYIMKQKYLFDYDVKLLLRLDLSNMTLILKFWQENEFLSIIKHGFRLRQMERLCAANKCKCKFCLKFSLSVNRFQLNFFFKFSLSTTFPSGVKFSLNTAEWVCSFSNEFLTAIS